MSQSSEQSLGASPHVVVLAFSPLHRDPRVLRQLRALAPEFRVSALGYTDPKLHGVRFLPVLPTYGGLLRNQIRLHDPRWKKRLRAGDYGGYYDSQREAVSARGQLRALDSPVDVVIANDVDTLPLAFEIRERTGARIYLDAHEFSPRQFDADSNFNRIWAGYRQHLCEEYIPRVDVMTTVCSGLADAYRSELKLSFPVHVVTNAPPYVDQAPSPLRHGRIRMVHHGLFHRHRAMESMVELMTALDDRFELDFMLLAQSRRALWKFKRRCRKAGRIRFRDPVATEQITREINDYDFGLYLVRPDNFNYRMVLPNKFFEFIQARLAIAIWPNQEMERIVKQWDNGIVTREFSVAEMAGALNEVSSEEVEAMKAKSHLAAEGLSGERNAEFVRDRVRELAGDSEGAGRGAGEPKEEFSGGAE